MGSQFYRLPIVQVDMFGQASYDLDLNNLPPGGAISVGETWNFQLWHREERRPEQPLQRGVVHLVPVGSGRNYTCSHAGVGDGFAGPRCIWGAGVRFRTLTNARIVRRRRGWTAPPPAALMEAP
ncbi:MAG: hypothetical protein R3E96_12635 [Planctomycetota bacterium]